MLFSFVPVACSSKKNYWHRISSSRVNCPCLLPVMLSLGTKSKLSSLRSTHLLFHLNETFVLKLFEISIYTIFNLSSQYILELYLKFDDCFGKIERETCKYRLPWLPKAPNNLESCSKSIRVHTSKMENPFSADSVVWK